MSLRFQATTNTAPIDDLLGFLDSMNAIVEEIGQEVADRHVPLLERELATNVPPKRRAGDKLNWTSPAQRKWWFASNGGGKGIPYQRTGNLANAWVIDVTSEGGIFAVKVSNPAPSAKFVYGTLAKDRMAAKSPQQKFHADQGWPLATELIRPVIEDMMDEFALKFRERIGEFGTASFSRRAYTGR